MSEFTKGPWTTHEVAAFGNGKRRIVGPGDVQVAHILKPADMTVAKYEANSRLIAAAPEMFALLSRLLRRLDSERVIGADIEEDQIIIGAVRDIIARIEPFGPHTHAGVWISRETADKIARDGA